MQPPHLPSARLQKSHLTTPSREDIAGPKQTAESAKPAPYMPVDRESRISPFWNVGEAVNPPADAGFRLSFLGETDSTLSRTRALLAPAKPVLRILDRLDPLATLAAVRKGQVAIYCSMP
jgi:hypothetical protein